MERNFGEMNRRRKRRRVDKSKENGNSEAGKRDAAEQAGE